MKKPTHENPNPEEIQDSTESQEELEQLLKAASSSLCKHGIPGGKFARKEYDDLSRSHYPELVSVLLIQIGDLIRNDDLTAYQLDVLAKLKIDFPEVDEFLKTEEIRGIYISKVIASIKNDLKKNTSRDFVGPISSIQGKLSEIKDSDDVKEFIESEEMKDLANNAAQQALHKGDIDTMMSICEEFNLKPQEFELDAGSAIHVLHTVYLEGDFDNADKIMRIFPEAREYFSKSNSLISLISWYLESDEYDNAAEICKIFKIPAQDIRKEVEETFKKFLTQTSDELEFEIGLSEEDIIQKGGTTAMALDILSNFDWEEKDIKPFYSDALQLSLEKNDLSAVEKVIDYFSSKVDIESVKGNKKLDYTTWLAESDLSEDISLTKKIFTAFKIKREEVEKVFSASNISFENKFILNLLVHPSLDQDMDKCYQMFGLNTDEDIYLKIKNLIHANEIDEEFTALGVTEIGDKGFDQLRENFHGIKESWFSNEPNLESINSSTLVKKFFMNYVNYNLEDGSEDDDEEDGFGWGNHDQESFDRMLEVYDEARSEIVPLPSYMVPSEKIEVDRFDRKVKIEWSEQFSSRYHQLLISIKAASELIDKENKPLSSIAEEIQSEYLKIVNTLKVRIDHVDDDKVKGIMEQQVTLLESIDVRSVEKFQENVTFLSKFRDLHPFLRKAIFAFSLMKNKGQKERMGKLYGKEPGLDEITTLLDFVDHITNQETMSEYFVDKQGRDAFKEVVGTKAIQEELVRTQNRKVVGKTTMQFVPTRNILTEFSGHIADACWASEYESILKDFPNFTSLIFLRNPGEVDEKLAGACLLIESEMKDGEKVLIVRGLNPTQSVINNLSIPDFFDKFKEYVKGIAEKDGRKVVLVVDDHSGGAGSNRPNLFEYMSSLDCPQVKLKSAEDTEFNGYDITGMCVALND